LSSIRRVEGTRYERTLTDALETVYASRAAVDQRQRRRPHRTRRVLPAVGRTADRVACAYTQPEILSADLSSLVLDLAQWGVSDPASLAFLDSPPAPALKEARSLLRELGALDADGRITEEGSSLRALALPPRLARMIVDSHRLGAGEDAADIAAVLTERGLGGLMKSRPHAATPPAARRAQRARAGVIPAGE
jgi:ATP-dependent helicase HrpB